MGAGLRALLDSAAVVGSSGCGKSTLLRLIAGLDTDYTGDIVVAGEKVRDTSLERGIVSQDHRLFPWLTASQNILAALRNAPLSVREKRDAVAQHIELVGLNGFANAFPHQLSGGMAQRVAKTRAAARIRIHVHTSSRLARTRSALRTILPTASPGMP
jgi:sulfonate transport system ATP-binding protein